MQLKFCRKTIGALCSTPPSSSTMKLFSVSCPPRLTRRAYSSNRKFLTQTRSDTKRQAPIFRSILPLGDPNGSVLPALDDWIQKGNPAQKRDIQRLVTQLTTYKRFRHALEVSLWMCNENRYPISPFDIGVRLKLILKNFGLEQSENYFNKIPENLRTYQIYLALLNCYTISKSVDKAEATLQKARDLGFAEKPIWFNLIMNLHCQLGNREKLGEWLVEMESQGVSYDQFTYSICIRACAMASDPVGMDRVMRMMVSDPAVSIDWQMLVAAARGYLRMGSIDEAMVILGKLKKQLNKCSRKSVLLGILLKLYAEAGKKEEMHRVWDLCRNGQVTNMLYVSMMRSLTRFDDIEGMEKILEEWESSAKLFDFRVPNFLIDVYCRDGRLEKAEALVARVASKGGSPLVVTWCHLTGGYMKKNQMDEAVRSLRKTISACPPKFASQKHSLMTCLGHLQKDEFRREAEELINSVRTKGISSDFCHLSENGEDQDSEDLLLEAVDQDEMVMACEETLI